MPGWETRLIGVDIEGRPKTVIGDEIAQALVAISFPHHEVHEGSTYKACYKSPEGGDIADNGEINFLMVVGVLLYPHLTFSVSAGGDAELFFYENTTFSDSGNVVARPNMKRTSSRQANMRTYHTPTIIGPGIELCNIFIPGGSGIAAIGAAQRESTEWILQRDTPYLLRLINRAGSAQPMGIVAQWYEESTA